MPRRSSRAAPAAKAPEAAPKRRASTRLSASEAEVKRVKSNIDLSGSQVKTTTKKSKYFEPEGSAESEEPASDTEDEDEDDSAYEEKDVDSESDDHEASDQDNESDSEEETKSARPKGKTAKDSVSDAASLKGRELWREGVRTGLAPGQEVIIAKPKARDPGDVPYEDETLHPNTRLFLLDLAKNNERQWLKGNATQSQNRTVQGEAGAAMPSRLSSKLTGYILQPMTQITAHRRRISKHLWKP